LSIGLHSDLGEWACRGTDWVPIYEVVSLQDPDAVAKELRRQLATFHRLMGRDPTHLDSHQHVHRQEPVRSVFVELAENLGVPLRHVTPGIRYCGDFYGQDNEGNSYPEILTIHSLTQILTALGPGWTELSCHPGVDAEEGLNTMYRCERAQEVAVLCDPRLRQSLAQMKIQLQSFSDAGQRRFT
jgi:predicted glycoside hydrolase/deacetylase ChbG (UPF0249 family)